MHKVYVVHSTVEPGTPYGVFWSKRDANHVRDKIGNSAVTEASLDDLTTFIRRAMVFQQGVAQERGIKPVRVPDAYEAALWAISEAGEVAGAMVAQTGDWKRNHPDRHHDDDIGKEVGQMVMMGFLAAITNPFAVILNQLERFGWYDEP